MQVKLFFVTSYGRLSAKIKKEYICYIIWRSKLNMAYVLTLALKNKTNMLNEIQKVLTHDACTLSKW